LPYFIEILEFRKMFALRAGNLSAAKAFDRERHKGLAKVVKTKS